MERINIIILAIFLFLFSNNLNAELVGEINFKLGELLKKTTSSKVWLPIDEGDPVDIGDTLKTGIESKCEIILKDGSIIRLSEKTIYIITEYSISKNKVKFSANLLAGESWSNVNKKDKNSRDFKVKTPIAVAAVIGTKYKTIYDGKQSSFTVMEGKVKVNLNKEKKSELKKTIEKSKSIAPRKSGAPKRINGPFQVTLKDWLQIVKGESLTIRQDGKYAKMRVDSVNLKSEWDNFKKTKK